MRRLPVLLGRLLVAILSIPFTSGSNETLGEVLAAGACAFGAGLLLARAARSLWPERKSPASGEIRLDNGQVRRIRFTSG